METRLQTPTEQGGIRTCPDTYSTTMIDINPMVIMDWTSGPTTVHPFDANLSQQFVWDTHEDLGIWPDTTNELYPDASDYPPRPANAPDFEKDSPLGSYDCRETKPPLPTMPTRTDTKGQRTFSNSLGKAKKEPRKLRTAPRRGKTTSSMRSISPTSTALSHESDKQRSARLHNDVEKAYRARLNSQFEALLDALPSGRGEEPLRPQRLSKAMVLDLARRRIGELTVELRHLRQDIGQKSEMVALLESGSFRERPGVIF